MKQLSIIIAITLLFFTGHAQQSWDDISRGRKEVFVSFSLKDAADSAGISSMVYVDNIEGDTVFAYVNKQQYSVFSDSKIPFRILTPPSMLHKNPLMVNATDIKDIQNWDFYPTYDAYLNMMYEFEADYPDICKLIELGTLSSGRKILALRITDNVNTKEAEPEFFYTSSMHGDETTGYVLMLRLSDYLLSGYGIDDQVTALVQNTDIYINPLANPDGTYANGNHTVYGATRTNANGVDINRNFPDPEDGPHPDGNAWQEETIIFMDFAEDHNFVMAANIHGGAELCNYPWDTWSRRHADDGWWQFVCHEYADTAQLHSPAGYMESYNDGITNGYDWYSISGSRQDYMNYFQQCREFTLEISNVKTLPENMLPDLWNYNYRSLLNYIEQVNYGLTGIVTDQVSGEPIRAMIEFLSHDADSSMVFSNAAAGNYHRPSLAGNYQLKISAPGYIPLFFTDVHIDNYTKTVLDAGLEPADFYADFTAEQHIAEPGSGISFVNSGFGNPDSVRWYFEGGVPSTSTQQDTTEVSYPQSGSFDVRLSAYKNGDSSSMHKEHYIRIESFYLMEPETVESCSGYFFDPGGMHGNYGNSQNIIMHFLPAQTGQQLKFIFHEFSIEYEENCDYDYLKIFNGSDVNDELIGVYCGSEIPDTITADNELGALTFEFHSDYSQTRQGWMAEFFCDSNVSVAENKLHRTGCFFYPNPAKDDHIFLRTKTEFARIKIFNSSGNLVLESFLNAGGNIDISSLQQGVYIIKLITNTDVYSSKLLRF